MIVLNHTDGLFLQSLAREEQLEIPVELLPHCVTVILSTLRKERKDNHSIANQRLILV